MTLTRRPSWIDNTPPHWRNVPLKRLVRLTNLRRKPEEDETYIGLEHVESWTGELIQDEAASADGLATCFEPKDVLFGKLRPYLAKAFLADFNGVASTEFLSFRPHDIDGKFLLYALLSKPFIGLVDAISYGVKMPRASWEQIGPLAFPVPSPDEQQAIVGFLDRETALIDTLVTEQEKLIALLAEKRQAVIFHAVTKGIDPTVPMKDSGIEWLGEVPEHWRTGKIRRFAKLESGHTPSRQHPEYWIDCTIPWFSLADVWQIREGKCDYIYDTKEKVSEIGLANSSARLLPKGTVMLSRTASVGFSAIMGCNMATTQDFANWVCGPTLLPEFLLSLLRSMKTEFERLMMGSTHQTIYMPDIAALAIAVPPIDEQESIVAFIRREVTEIDALINDARTAIDLINERRSALITAAITGQIDVRARNAAAESVEAA